MSKNITELGPKEAQFISLFATKNSGFFRLEEAVQFWKSRKLTYDLLWRLQKKGWIERIERGKYLNSVIARRSEYESNWRYSLEYLVPSNLKVPFEVAWHTSVQLLEKVSQQ